MRENELEAYLSKGVERIVRGILRASAENPKESLFMARYAVSAVSYTHLTLPTT